MSLARIDFVDLYKDSAVFINCPYRDNYAPLLDAITFSVAASNLVPILALDFSDPDRLRLQNIMKLIKNSAFSVHELSDANVIDDDGYTRMNMPLEMGMALFYDFYSSETNHRCLFFVSKDYEHQKRVSDISGLDPVMHENNEMLILNYTYEFLQKHHASKEKYTISTKRLISIYSEYISKLENHFGSMSRNKIRWPARRELIFRICESQKLWEWRSTRRGRDHFPRVALEER